MKKLQTLTENSLNYCGALRNRLNEQTKQNLINNLYIHVYTMLKTVNVREEIVKEVVKFGNGSVVYTPKKWLGKQVLVILEEKPIDIKGEVLKILKPHLQEIESVFLFGSFARNEQTETSDVDVLIISNKKFDLKKSGRLDFLVMPRETFIEKFKRDETLFLYQIVKEAKPIFNGVLLEGLRQVEIKPDFGKFLRDSLGAFKTVSQFLEIDKKKGKKYTDSTASVYSLVLRLKTLFLIQRFLKNQGFSNNEFKEFIKKHGFKDNTINDFIEIYRAERDNKKIIHGTMLKDVEKLFETTKIEFLRTEKLVKKWAIKRGIRKQ